MNETAKEETPSYTHKIVGVENKETDRAIGKYTSILVALSIGLLCLAVCALLAWHISPKGERYLTLLIQLAGMACGGFLGFLASPKAPSEQVTFLTFAKAISAFLSGYALSKIDNLIDTLTKNSDLYILIFFLAIIVSLMMVYSYRAYVQKPPPKEHDASKETAKPVVLTQKEL
jgi:hypothetical protein